MSLYNNNICLNNIYYLANLKDIRISKLEENAGVSNGYLSRLKKGTSETTPNINALCSFANSLEIPLEILIEYDLQQLTDTELCLIKFLKKLIIQTDSNQISWNYSEVNQFNNKIHPISIGGEIAGNDWIFSAFTKKAENISDEIYWIETDSSHSFYLFNVDVNDYELYLCIQGKEKKPVCSSNRSNEEIFRQLMSELYYLIHKKVREPQLDKETIETIDAFLQE